MIDATITSYMPGDILFYASLQGDIGDRLISDWTASQFVHVAIATSALIKVEALFHGVVRTPIDGRTVAGAFHINTRSPDASQLAAALLWLNGQVGQMYGWGDIVNAVLAKVEHGFSIDVGEHRDCSSLASEFLVRASILQVNIDTHEITPAMLAGYLGVVPGSK